MHAEGALEARIRARLRRRRHWLRALLKRLPRRASLHRVPVLRRWATWAKSCPHLWSYRRPHLTAALYAGSLLCMLPILGAHIFIAMPIAWLLRANLAVTVGIQLVNNVFTAAPIVLMTYEIGEWPLRWISVWNHASMPGPVVATACGVLVCGLLLGALLDGVVRAFAWRHRHDLDTLRLLTVNKGNHA